MCVFVCVFLCVYVCMRAVGGEGIKPKREEPVSPFYPEDQITFIFFFCPNIAFVEKYEAKVCESVVYHST